MGTNGAAVPAMRWTPCHQDFQCSGATAAMVAYFTTLATPAPGATCAPDYRPCT
jgi:hypothetical protein